MRHRRLTLGGLPARVGRGESGFTIIEVLASAVLLTIAAVGLFSAFDTATRASGRNKARTVAASLAQSDQERLRSLTATQLTAVNGAPAATKAVDGKTFTITSRADWTTDPNSTTSCAGLGKEPGYMRITSTVDWPDRGSLAPVKADSIKAVPNGGYKTTRGSLAVKLLNRSVSPPGGAAGVTVSISGASSASGVTNASGCVLFPFIPVGAYTVNVNQAGYVVPAQPNGQVVNKGVTVPGEQTASVSFVYDQAASLGVSFFTHDPSSAVGNPDTATTGDGFTVANAGLDTPSFESFGLLTSAASTAATGAANTAVPVASAQKVLFPFADGYKAWSGKCQQNDPTPPIPNPTGIGFAPGTAPTVNPGSATTGVAVLEPMLKLTVKRYTTSAQVPGSSATTLQAAKVLINPAVAGCTAPFTVNTASTGTIATASQPTLPYGTYSVCVQDKTSSPTKRVVATVNNTVRNGQALTLYLPFGTTNPTSCP